MLKEEITNLLLRTTAYSMDYWVGNSFKNYAPIVKMKQDGRIVALSKCFNSGNGRKCIILGSGPSLREFATGGGKLNASIFCSPSLAGVASDIAGDDSHIYIVLYDPFPKNVDYMGCDTIAKLKTKRHTYIVFPFSPPGVVENIQSCAIAAGAISPSPETMVEVGETFGEFKARVNPLDDTLASRFIPSEFDYFFRATLRRAYSTSLDGLFDVEIINGGSTPNAGAAIAMAMGFDAIGFLGYDLQWDEKGYGVEVYDKGFRVLREVVGKSIVALQNGFKTTTEMLLYKSVIATLYPMDNGYFYNLGGDNNLSFLPTVSPEDFLCKDMVKQPFEDRRKAALAVLVSLGLIEEGKT